MAEYIVYTIGHPGSPPVPGGEDVPPCWGPVEVSANSRGDAIKIAQMTHVGDAARHARCTWMANPKAAG
jgi:hypothetical protein